MGRYGSYCPVALASEVLGERWSILIVMTLVDGVTRFNDIQRALPRISPSTLTSRLRALEDAGVLAKKGRSGMEYGLTEAGRELEPIIMSLSTWGQRWARDMEPDDLDPQSLAWSMHLRIDTDAMPVGRTAIEFDLSGGARDPSPFWIVCTDGAVDVCVKHPGYPPDLCVTADIRRFVEAWRGFRSLRAEIAAGRIRLSGPAALRRAFPRWLLLSMAAPVERQRPGRERGLSRRTRRARA